MSADGVVGFRGSSAPDADARTSNAGTGGGGHVRSSLTVPVGLPGGLHPESFAALTADERAAIEAATGEMGNKPDAVKLGWLKMRTKEAWTTQRYTLTVGRALEKLRRLAAEP